MYIIIIMIVLFSSLDVLVVDGGDHRNITTLKVSIIDRSVHAPVIAPDFLHLYVRDDADPDADVHKMTATDKDGGMWEMIAIYILHHRQQ